MKADALDPWAVVAAVRTALNGLPSAPLYGPPWLSQGEQTAIAAMLAWEAAGDKLIAEFEKVIAEHVGRKHAIAVSSGTAALHLALLALDVRPGDGVAVPALTFAAAGAAVRYCGAAPNFYDDGRARHGRATIGVNLLGLWDTGRGESHHGDHAPWINDAAQALGSEINGKPIAKLGTIAILSFNNNKIVTTGGGGMVLTDRDDIAVRVRFLATTAKEQSPHHYVHSEVGFNYRMAAPAAALGLVMFDRLDDTLARKKRLHEAYRTALADVPGVTVVEAPEGVTWNHWLNAIEVPAGQRDAVLTALTAAGYGCRALFTPLPWLEPYKRFAEGQRFPEAERRFATTVCLPSQPELAS